ncbi:reverse transcriptase domain-containing protein [Tanacetum coccineum]
MTIMVWMIQLCEFSTRHTKFKIGDEFLKILNDNAFNGIDGGDVIDHNSKVLEILEWIKIPNVNENQLRLHVFPISLSGHAKEWWDNEIKDTTTTWNELGHYAVKKSSRIDDVYYFGKDYELVFVPGFREMDSLVKKNVGVNNGVGKVYLVNAFVMMSKSYAKPFSFWKFQRQMRIGKIRGGVSDMKLAFTIVQNYVNNTWAKFGLQKLMKNDDGVFLFKFASKDGLERVLERGLWIIRNTPLTQNRWTPNVSLKRGEVNKVPVWIKLYNVLVVAYSPDGLSLIATQVGKPFMLDAFTSSMCENAWGLISFARALVEISSDFSLKHEFSMVIPLEDGSGHTRDVIKVEYQWKPPHCVDCKIFGHTIEKCPKRVTIMETPAENKDWDTSSTTSTHSDGFTEVRRKKTKGKKADQQSSRQIDGIRLNKQKPNFFWQKKESL